MKVKCPHCGHIDKAPDEYSGKHVDCPKCKQPVIALAYDPGIIEANKAKTNDAAKKPKPPPEPEGPILLPFFGLLLIILSVLSVPVASENGNFGVAFGGVIAGVVLIALAHLQRYVQKVAYWGKRIHEELRRQNGAEKK